MEIYYQKFITLEEKRRNKSGDLTVDMGEISNIENRIKLIK